MLWYAMFCYDMLRYVMLCYVMLCLLCYVCYLMSSMLCLLGRKDASKHLYMREHVAEWYERACGQVVKVPDS